METIALENIIHLVVRQVIQELKKQNIAVVYSKNNENNLKNNSPMNGTSKYKTETIDMSKYKTPILTEHHLNRLHMLTGEIKIPKGTIITPKARQRIRQLNIKVTNSEL